MKKKISSLNGSRLRSYTCQGEKTKIYVVFGNSDKEHVLNSIAEKFVYKNSDWFYYLDLKNDYLSDIQETQMNIRCHRKKDGIIETQ